MLKSEITANKTMMVLEDLCVHFPTKDGVVRAVDGVSGRVFSITTSGEVVYREALEMYGGVVRLNELSKGNSQILTGNIVIYRSSHLDISFLNPILAEFRKKHPNVTFSVSSTPCADVARALQQRVASLGFCTRPETAQQLKQYSMKPQEFVFFCGPTHPLYKVESPDLGALSNSNIVGFEGESFTGALASVVRYRARYEIGDAVIATTSSIVDLIDMVRHTPAIASLSINHLKKHASDLWQIPLNTANPMIEVFALLDTDRHMTQAERELITFLENTGIWSD